MAGQEQEKLRPVLGIMREITEDFTIPKNVRKIVQEGIEKLKDIKEDVSVSIATFVYSLEELSNDINIQSHARTALWSVISELEKLKNELAK